MRPDLWLGGITIIMSVLGTLLSFQQPQGRLKLLCGALFIVLGGFAVYFTVKQSNDAAVANTRLNDLLERLRQSTDQINASSAATARAEALNTKLQQRLLDSNATISDLARRGINTSTGGDSFCYLQFALINGNAGLAFAIPHGEYPLYGVAARVVNLHRFEASVKAGNPDLGVTYKVGDMTYIAAFPVATIPFSSDTSQDFNIFFSARNGMWTELIRLRKVNGSWTEAIRVLRGDGGHAGKNEKSIFEKIDKGFPLESLDWNPGGHWTGLQ